MEEGWKRRTVLSEPRLSEVVEAYEQLGLEVRLEPVDPEDPELAEEGCTLCFDDPEVLEESRVVYTRPRQKGAVEKGNDDLFD